MSNVQVLVFENTSRHEQMTMNIISLIVILLTCKF